MIDENGPIPERYAEATRALAALHGRDLPTGTGISGSRTAHTSSEIS